MTHRGAQPKKRGCSIKKTTVRAATRYGLDGRGTGGLGGFVFRSYDKNPAAILALLARVMPMQVIEPPEEEVYRTSEEFDAACRARGLPEPSKCFAYCRDHAEESRKRASKNETEQANASLDEGSDS